MHRRLFIYEDLNDVLLPDFGSGWDVVQWFVEVIGWLRLNLLWIDNAGQAMRTIQRLICLSVQAIAHKVFAKEGSITLRNVLVMALRNVWWVCIVAVLLSTLMTIIAKSITVVSLFLFTIIVITLELKTLLSLNTINTYCLVFIVVTCLLLLIRNFLNAHIHQATFKLGILVCLHEIHNIY